MNRWKSRRRPPRRSGLRVRLTRLFALVAILAVLLTSWLTVAAAFRVLARYQVTANSTAAPWVPAGPADWGASWAERRQAAEHRRAWERWWGQLSAQERTRWSELGHAAKREIIHTSFLAALLAALLAVTIAAIVTRQLTRPLARLAEGAARLERGERGLRLPEPRRHDELRDLTVAFNTFVEGLERQEAWRRALVADVAHDLRTPLAVMRAEIEAMQDGIGIPDEIGLRRLHSEVLLLARLVDDLRTLSLAEGRALSLRPERVDVAQLLRGAAGAYESRAAERGMSVRMCVQEPLHVRADPDRLTQVLHNVLDNALRYAGRGSVELRGERQGTHAVISVRDEGPGFSEEALSRAFERFYRGDASRSRDPAGRAGSGLGLAIARALVELQDGRVEVDNHPQGGARLTLYFPLG